MGLIQTHEQLKFSYQAIIEGTKSLELENGSMDDSEEKVAEDGVLRRIKKIKTQGDSSSSIPTSNGSSNNNESRDREREDRKRKTQEKIDHIKNHKKQLEERSRFLKRLGYGFLVLFISLGASYVYSYLTSSSPISLPSSVHPPVDSPSLNPLPGDPSQP